MHASIIRWPVARSSVRLFAALLVTLVALVALAGARAGAATVPKITSVTFTGTEAAPVVVIAGSGFGTQAGLGTPQTPGCQDLGATGNDYGNNLNIQDLTENFNAGGGVTPGACVGLVISSYSDTQIVLTPGSDYSSYGWFPGDRYTLHLLGAVHSATVVYHPVVVSRVTPKVGSIAGGTTVTIAGNAFLGATAVAFGSVSATSFTVVSNTSIRAVSPPQAAGAVDVTVTAPGGTSPAVLADQFTYQPVVVSRLSPIGGSIAGGTTVTIIGTSFAGATSVAFGSVPAASFTFVSNTAIRAVSPPQAAGAVDVTVTAPGGTSPVVAADRFTYRPPIIRSVVFTGTVASPTVTITGLGFGSEAELGTPQTPGCQDIGATGNDYGNNLNIQDWTDNWLAGAGTTPGACVGLVISSYSDTQIVLTPGSDYSSYGWFPGDRYTLSLLGASRPGRVAYTA